LYQSINSIQSSVEPRLHKVNPFEFEYIPCDGQFSSIYFGHRVKINQPIPNEEVYLIFTVSNSLEIFSSNNRKNG